MTAAIDPALTFLTDEQLVAAGTPLRHAYIEAAPGSGKTTVAAQRFGAQRYMRTRAPDGETDDRAVVAVSFTRSATWELRQRVRQSWGPSALQWPHRVVTLDTLVYGLLEYLLINGQLRWPGGHRHLEVHDSWKVLAGYFWIRGTCELLLDGREVVVSSGYAVTLASRVNPQEFQQAIQGGRCTHEEIRRVLGLALQLPDIVETVTRRIALTTRALIVDEIFDANALDLAIIELASLVGAVTVVGDPWQALYGFRGARPDAVPPLLERARMVRLPLTASFRWRTDEQRSLAEALRNGQGVTLPTERTGIEQLDVVLACRWQQLWDTGDHVLPLAFGSAKGNTPEAAATLLLNHLTRSVIGENATYTSDAMATLGITDVDAISRLEPAMKAVLEDLSLPGRPALINAYESLVTAIATESRRQFPRAHWRYTDRLKMLKSRLSYRGQLIPGMTVHQAKGREWDRVGVSLSEEDRATLAGGLHVGNERHRQLYVACTRARFETVSV